VAAWEANRLIRLVPGDAGYAAWWSAKRAFYLTVVQSVRDVFGVGSSDSEDEQNADLQDELDAASWLDLLADTFPCQFREF
jgi:hypothetical protein